MMPLRMEKFRSPRNQSLSLLTPPFPNIKKGKPQPLLA